MYLTSLLKIGAGVIQSNSDDSTSGLDVEEITTALEGLLSDGAGGLDLANLMSGLSKNGLTDIVGSWLGNGENSTISSNQIGDLLGLDKVSEFASKLGISEESAKKALADMLPAVVDKATSGEGSIVDDMLSQVGGSGNAMDMLGKMFR